MSFALTAGSEPISGYRCVRRLGRSNYAETWLLESDDETHRVLKWLYDGSSLRQARKLTSYRHPFLIHWERVEAQGVELILIADWAEEMLEQSVGPGRSLPPRETLLRYMEELAEALDYLHTKHKVVHGRLKLSQVGIQHQHAKLLDWGLHSPSTLQTIGWSLADLQTTAPEVLLGQLEPASDQFSLAALYLQVAHGRHPLTANNLPEFFQLRNTKTIEPQDLRGQEYEVLERALHAEPASRYPTCAAFMRALRECDEASKTSVPTNITPPIVAPPRSTDKAVIQPSTFHAPLPTPETVSAGPTATPTVMIKSLMAMESGTSSRHPDSAFLNLNNLAYHSKVQSFGILTPTLMLGIGKLGHAVLKELSHVLHHRYDGAANLPHIRLLAIDQLADKPTAPVKPGDLQAEQQLHCPPTTSATWQAASQDPNLSAWLPPTHLPDASAADVEICPSLARLSLVKHYEIVRQRLQQECRVMLQSDSLMRSKQHTGLSIRQDLVPTCYIIASLNDQVALGCLSDLAYLVRSVISEAGWGPGQVTGIVFLPPPNASKETQARTYASLTELHHYTQENYFTAQYGNAGEVTHSHPPFEHAFFHHLSDDPSPAAEYEQIKQIANWLHRDVASELGTLRLASRDATDAFASRTTNWFGQGMSILQSSQQQMQQLLKRRMLGKLVTHWLSPEPEAHHSIRGDGERFLEQYIHSASSLLERFQHMTAVVIGREPSQLIDEWIAPLRKGAAARPPLENLARDIMNKVETTFGTSSGYQQSPALVAIQHEAESVAMDIASKIQPFLMQYLDQPGMRLGASLQLGRLLLHWITDQLTDLQASHMEIHQDMLRAERTITQMMTQEERTFAIMGRQRLVSQIVSDLSDYPSRVLKEDMFARAVYVFQHIRNSIEDVIKKLEPAELSLRELEHHYLQQEVDQPASLLLDGENSLQAMADKLLSEMPEDTYVRLDNDLNEALVRFQSNYQDVCMGKGPSFNDILDLLDNSIEECMEGMLPSEDAAEQLLTQPSQAVVEQLRQSYRNARPDLMENKRSRQGAFCLMLTPGSDAGQELLQMAQATLPQIVAAPEGLVGEILFYRETGCLLPQEIYQEGQAAYQSMAQEHPALLHSRFDIAYWHSIASSLDSSMPLPRTQTDSSLTVSV